MSDCSKPDVNDGLDDAFDWACENSYLNVAKALYPLKKTHKPSNTHYAFIFACKNGYWNVVKYLLSLSKDTYEQIDIHANDDYAFKCSSFKIRHILVKHEPNYNWKKVDGYKEYIKELDQMLYVLT